MRKIDLVACIDGTGSMSPCIENVKANTKEMVSRIYGGFINGNGESEISMLRVKVIVFRDYESEGEDAIVESDFFELPSEMDAFDKYLEEISAFGGGDMPENGLEALYYAMTSKFVAKGPKDRQVICLMTDADALELGARSKHSGYPDNMVSQSELDDIWAGVSQTGTILDKNKRLVIFAPEGTKYEKLTGTYNRSCFTATNLSNGMAEVDFETIIRTIVASAV